MDTPPDDGKVGATAIARRLGETNPIAIGQENADPDAEYPRLVETGDEAPPQYSDWDADEE